MEEYKKDFEKSLSNNEYSEKLFVSIAENIVKSYELTDYVKKVLLLPINSRDSVGYYDFKNIIIDYTKIECINLEYYYFDLFVTFFHELEHAKQKKLLDKFKLYYNKVISGYKLSDDEVKEYTKIHTLYISENTINNNYKIYNKKHDLFPTEHEANYMELYSTIKLMSSFSENIHDSNLEKILNFYNKNNILLLRLLRGYKNSAFGFKSPVEQLGFRKIDKAVKEFMYKSELLSNYEKLILGLPIDKILYLKMFNDALNNKNIKHDDYVLQLR